MELRDELMVLKEAWAASKARPNLFKKGGDEFIDAVSKIMALPAADSSVINGMYNTEISDTVEKQPVR